MQVFELRSLALAGAFLTLSVLGARGHAAPGTCPAAIARDERQDCGVLAALPRLGDGDPRRDDLGASEPVPLTPDAFRSVPSASLIAEPSSFLHKPIALDAARCFYFAVGDYRCLSRAAVPLAVQAAIVIPPMAEAAVERGCTAHAPADCALRILLVPIAARTVKVGDRSVVVFRTGSVMVAPGGSTRP